MSAIRRYFDSARRREESGISLSDEFIRSVCGSPKSGTVAIANAAQSAVLLEADRDDRTQQRLELLRRALPYVMDARQGRGDLELECLIRGELGRG